MGQQKQAVSFGLFSYSLDLVKNRFPQNMPTTSVGMAPGYLFLENFEAASLTVPRSFTPGLMVIMIRPFCHLGVDR